MQHEARSTTTGRYAMREVVVGSAATARKPARLVVASDAAVIPDEAWDRSLVWNPETTGPTSTIGWDLLSGITAPEDADRIAEHLLRDAAESAVRWIPEAELVTANLLLAAVRGRRPLEDVIDWVATGDFSDAYLYLLSRGDNGPAEDINGFFQSSAVERRCISALIRDALLPLNHGTVLAVLGPAGVNRCRLPEPFGMLHVSGTDVRASWGSDVYVLAPEAGTGARTSGLGAALVGEVALRAAICGAPLVVRNR